MSELELMVLSLAALATSALSAVVGSGGGTALIVIMLQFMAPGVAIPVHGAVQLVSNGTRSWLLREHMAWPVIWRFVLLMPIGSAIGIALFTALPAAAIKIIIGLFVIATLGARWLRERKERSADIPMWGYLPAGFITGVFNIIVGVTAPILGVLVIRKELVKEQIVATLALFGMAGHLFKVIGFTLIGFSFATYWPAIVVMVPAAIIGTRLGRAYLAGMDEAVFLLAFRVVMVAIALKLIVWDGIAALIG